LITISDPGKFTVRIRLDEINRKILEIFIKYPNRKFKTGQIRTILAFEGLELGYGVITLRLTNLSLLHILTSEMGSSVKTYWLAEDFKINP
jgi:hypothetical protein